MTLPNNTEVGKRVSATDSSHRIRTRSGQNKSVRDEELISREAGHLSIHLSSTDDLTVHFGQCISTKKRPLCLKYCITKRVLANSIRICQEHTLRDRLFPYKVFKCCVEIFPTSIRQASHVTRSCSSFQEAVRPLTAIERVIVNLIKFYKQRSKTGLVSFNKRFKCVENSHFSATDYCTVQLAPAAKLMQYYL